jgi:hypothetical protein
MRRPYFGILLLLMFGTICTWAKRVPPKDVPPVVVSGIRYSAHGDGRDSYIVASDLNDKELWKVKVFHTRIEFWRGEEDNQWVFISDLKSIGNSLLVRDEKNRCYSIDLGTQHVKKTQCEGVFPPQEARH